MAEYIDKQAAIADLNETYDKMSGFHPQFYHGYQVAVNRLRVFQTAEVEPVRHGRLSETGMDEAWCSWGDCSACGRSNIMGAKYCNWCGVKLDGGADNG